MISTLDLEDLMAAATTARRRTTKAAAKPAPKPQAVEPEVEDTELNVDEDFEPETDEDLEELEEDEVADAAPTTKKSKAGDDITFGIRDLVELIKTETGEETDPRALRTLIRKMARDESGRVNREIKAGNRTRYNWSGPNDPEVRNIVDAFKAGELEEEKKAKLAALKEQKAAKAAAKKDTEGDEKPARRRAAKKSTTARKAKPAPVEEVEDDEELDFEEE